MQKDRQTRKQPVRDRREGRPALHPMSPCGSRYCCSTEQHNDSLSDLTWAGLRVKGETAKCMWKSSRLCNQQRKPAVSWKSKYASRWLTLQFGTEMFTSSVWGRTNSSVAMESVWAHELYIKTNSTALNEHKKRHCYYSYFAKAAQPSDVYSAIFPPKVYLSLSEWFTRKLYHLVQLCKLRSVIALYFGW